MNDDPKSLHAASMSKMCPALTIAGALMRTAQPPGSTAIPTLEGMMCQGPECGWYLPTTDEKGTITGGGCSIPAIPSFLSQTNVGLVQTLNILARRAKLVAVG